MYKHIICLLMVGLFLLGGSVAQAQEPEYTGVDFIFLLDQSGSMCGEACGSSVETANDPYGFRFEGPKFAIIDFLGDQMSEIYTSTTARIAIVEFGQDIDLSLYKVGKNDDEYENVAIEAIIPPTQIESERQAWKIQRDNLLAEMNSYQTRREKVNLGNTDHVGAIKEANRLLDQMEQSDSSNRLKVVVLLTDGKSSICYPRGPENDPWETDYCIPSETLFRQVEQEVNNNFDTQDHYFFVVGMADTRSNYWGDYGPGWEKLAERYNGEARLVKSQNEVAEFMGEIVNMTLAKLHSPTEGPGEPPLEWIELGYFPVRPYLQTVTFYIIKRNPEDTVSIYNAQDVPLNLTLDDNNCEENTCLFKLGRLVDKVVVTRPQPGKWRVEASSLNKTDNLDDRVRFGIRSLFFAPELIKPVGGKYIEGSPVDIQIDMTDLDGNPVPQYEDNLYDLNTAAIIQPKIAQIKLDPDTFSGRFFANQTGDSFQIHLLGTTHNPGGEEFQLLDHDVEGTFSIERLSGQLMPPQRVFQNKNMSLEYQLNLQGFQALPEGYSYTGEFLLSHPDLAQPLTVETTYQGDGLFTGTVQPEQAGSYTIDFKLFLLETATNKKIPLPLDTTSDSPCCVKVEPTIGLELVLLTPLNGSEQMARDWFLQLLPLHIEVGLRRLDNQQFVNWSEVRANGAGPSISVQIQNPTDNPGPELRTVNTSETGKFLFVGDNLGLGSWTIDLPKTLALKDDYVLLLVEPLSATIIRTENYLAWSLWGGLVLVILGIALVWSKRRRDVSRPPYLVGHLTFLDDTDMPLGVNSFPAERNRCTITNPPAATGIKTLQAFYVDEQTIKLIIDGESTIISHGTEWDSGTGYKIMYENPTLVY